ncbi:MAG: alpha-amylase family glycosyl hydrolase [Acidimicrobiia bacterium]
MATGEQWWVGEVLYQIYPRSYMDTDGDGVGDLRGIRDRLDHLAWLGVRAIWLSPVTVSPNADYGYDVADYYDVDPSLGTLEDLDALVAAAADRGIGVLMDLVPNHTSDRHPWFVASASSRDDPKRDWYVWADPAPDGGPPNNWVSVFGGSAWTLEPASGQYYLHNFLDGQPDLNWWSDEVRDEFDRILRFWFDRGVAGFRIDVAHMVVKDRDLRDNPPAGDGASLMEQMRGQRQEFNSLRPEVHDVHRRWRRVADGYDPPRLLVGETFVEHLDDLFPFLDGDQLHLDFNIPFAHTAFDVDALGDVIERTEAVLRAGTPVWTGSNHDISRFPTRWAEGDPDRARVALMLLLTLRGTVFLYQGDEIGMTDVEIPRDELLDPVGIRFHPYAGRDPVRTPMQWTAEPGAGFTGADVTPWLRFGDLACNVADQRDDPMSFLNLTHDLIALRHATPDLATGAWRRLEAPAGVLGYARGEGHVVVLHLGPDRVDVPTPASSVVVGTRRDRDGEAVHGTLALSGPEGVVLRVGSA